MVDTRRLAEEMLTAMELVTGRLSPNEYEAEVSAIADFLVAARVGSVLVTFGAGCNFGKVDPLNPVPVAPALLASFVTEQQERGTFRIGQSDLFLKADDGRVAFLLCEEGDIHCYADAPELAEPFRARWAAEYPEAYEADRESERWRRLWGGPWRPFGEAPAGPQLPE